MQQLLSSNTTTTDTTCSLAVPSHDAIITLCVVLSLIAIIASFGNILTILVIVINPLKNLHNPFIYFLLNLSVADALQGLISIPFVVYYLSKHKHGLHITSIFLNVLTLISMLSVFFSTIVISVDRCIAITRPIEYRTTLSWQRCLKLSLAMWLIAILSGLFLIVFPYKNPYLAYYSYFILAVGIIAMLILFFRVHRFLKKHEETFREKLRSASITSTAQRYNTEKKVTKVLLMVLAVFMVTYVPALVMLNITKFCLQCSCSIRFDLFMVRYILLVSNSAVNPFIYTIRLKDFRNSLKSLFHGATRKRETRSLTSSESCAPLTGDE